MVPPQTLITAIGLPISFSSINQIYVSISETYWLFTNIFSPQRPKWFPPIHKWCTFCIFTNDHDIRQRSLSDSVQGGDTNAIGDVAVDVMNEQFRNSVIDQNNAIKLGLIWEQKYLIEINQWQ